MQNSTVDIETIASSMVGYDHPYCTKHRRPHKMNGTLRNVRGTILEVIRYHYCPQCRCEGAEPPPPLVNSVDFGNSF